jgi:hypothetical protein
MTYETPTALRRLNSDHFQGLLGNALHLFPKTNTESASNVHRLPYPVEAPALARVSKRNLVT